MWESEPEREDQKMAADGAPAIKMVPLPSAQTEDGKAAPTSLERLDRAHDSGDGEPVHTVVVLWEDGRRYRGSLLADIVAYRMLRFRDLAGGAMSADDLDKLTALEARLRQPRPLATGPTERRLFRRFKCRFPAKLLCLVEDDVDVLDVQVVDVSAGGARLVHPESIELGRAVALVIAVGDERDGGFLVTFPSRVVWSEPGASGIMFAGHPRTSADAAGRSAEAPTHALL
jgi:hypothetical protein